MRGMLLNMDERKWVLQESIALPDLVLSHSVFLQQMFARNTSVPIRVLRHGLEIEWLDDFHGKTSADKLRIGYIGQLQWTKGVHVLIEAFQRSQLDGWASLQIWGDPTRNLDYVQMLQDCINNDQAIELRGRFEQDQIATVLAEIDVLVVPSLWYENSPLVIKEAFVANTPVIASDLGGMAELVTHNVDGLLYEQGDAEDLARQLRRIFDEPGLLDRLQRGIQPVKTIHQEIDELEAVYSDLIARR